MCSNERILYREKTKIWTACTRWMNHSIYAITVTSRIRSIFANDVKLRESFHLYVRVFLSFFLFFLSFEEKKKNLFLEFWFSIFVLFWLIDPTKLCFFYFFNLVLHSFLINLAKINFISIKMINSQADLPPLLKNLSIKFRFLLCLSSLLFLLINFSCANITYKAYFFFKCFKFRRYFQKFLDKSSCLSCLRISLTRISSSCFFVCHLFDEKRKKK